MSKPTQELTELELDLLTELFNVGIGRSASALSEMLKQEIKLSVPEISFCSLEELLQQFKSEDSIISISQDISGPFDMQSMLLFPESGSLDVIRAMLGDHLSDEMATELQQEAFTEIGNIVLNACIGIIAKMLDDTFTIDLPKFSDEKPENLFKRSYLHDSQIIMSMQVDLTLTSNCVSGHIAFILGSVSMDNIKGHLNKIINGV
ncbi:MAG: chemotaxis protein CheC [Gammaproteobacteria bacterium]|nr:chemotaxis protein CheC [Gammaproteobacteria bacterium]